MSVCASIASLLNRPPEITTKFTRRSTASSIIAQNARLKSLKRSRTPYCSYPRCVSATWINEARIDPSYLWQSKPGHRGTSTGSRQDQRRNTVDQYVPAQVLVARGVTDGNGDSQRHNATIDVVQVIKIPPCRPLPHHHHRNTHYPLQTAQDTTTDQQTTPCL